MKKPLLSYVQARYTTREIARALRVTEYAVWRDLLAAGYDYDPQTGRVWKPVDERRILRLLKQGQSVNRIVHDLRVDTATVNRIRRAAQK